MGNRSTLAKLSAPRCRGALDRPRLFRALDAIRKGGARWVHGPPGSGKTTLVATWLRARGLRSAWVRIDAGDRCPGGFLESLAAAVPGRRPAAPPASAALAGAEAALRRRLRGLLARLPRGCALVLDDVQEAGPDLAPSLRLLLEELPPGAMAVLSSRTPPPAALARLRASGDLACLDGEALAFDAAEGLALARLRRIPGEREAVGTLVAETRGWAAGVALRLCPPGAAPCPVQELLSGEVLDRVDGRTRRLLLEASLLPSGPAESIARATGAPEAGDLLGSLAARGLFVTCEGPTWTMHEVLRSFLRARAERELAPERRAELRRVAAPAVAAPLRVAILGPPVVELSGVPVGASARPPRRPLELLRFLAAQPRLSAPEHVAAEALWPDAEGDAAHHALETTLYRLRLLVGAASVVQRERRLSLSAERCWVDAAELEARVESGLVALDRGRQDPAAAAADARSVLALYRGPLLEEAGDPDWAAEPRERIRRRLSRWLDALPSLLGDPAEAARTRRELVARDPALGPAAVLRIA